MQKYKHILLATDLHSENMKATHKAVAQAEQNGAKLSVVHVVEPLPAYAMGYFGSVNIEKELIDEAQKNMAELGKKINVAEQDLHVEIGSVKVAVLSIAKEVGADLIIVGSHGRHGLEKLLGSTAAGVLHGAECDVLIVRTHD